MAAFSSQWRILSILLAIFIVSSWVMFVRVSQGTAEADSARAKRAAELEALQLGAIVRELEHTRLLVQAERNATDELRAMLAQVVKDQKEHGERVSRLVGAPLAPQVAPSPQAQPITGPPPPPADTSAIVPARVNADEHILWRLPKPPQSKLQRDWIYRMSPDYKSTPYYPATPESEPPPPKKIPVPLPPASVTAETERIVALLKHRPKLASMFKKCYPNTLETTATLLADNTTYIITGDIDLMWLRDSSAQVHQYLSLASDPEIQRIVEGLVRRQTIFIPYNPYGSSFRTALRPEDDLQAFHVGKARNVFCSMHNYELDSLAYHMWLSHEWWKASGRTAIFDDEWLRVIKIIVDLLVIEQKHEEWSPYRYVELTRDGLGSPTRYTGMTWSGFRPSDDQTQYGYLVPANIFAVVALQGVEEIVRDVYHDETFATLVAKLWKEIDNGIHDHGVVETTTNGKIYAYEVDGLGNQNLMDDANVPSLLAIPYFKYRSERDPEGVIWKNTRRWVLSSANPYYYSGTFANGVGSIHTNSGYVWPMSIIMRGLTTTDAQEIEECVRMLESTDAGTDFIHESFNPMSPEAYSRHWFAWANSLFSEFVIKHIDVLSSPPPKGNAVAPRSR
eukprot:TRINITY_DN6298_c0_g1_i1.p1 TRINITY_DN6298_c0_g1~~TRINITY_DN6298_c0_g1_i1.p1  ORF type:complete len:621 (+),score=220.88 TRINITY_DN6298_c0_g1_i1:1691-3553(+)